MGFYELNKHGDSAVVVAVSVVRMVEVTGDQIIRVVAMRDGLVAAAGAMHMGIIVSAALVVWGAGCRVCSADFQHMLVHMICMEVVQVAVMDKVDMTVMLNRDMAAVCPVQVGMVLVNLAVAHRDFSFAE